LDVADSYRRCWALPAWRWIRTSCLWKPGKLISIPRHVHVPKLHHFYSYSLVPSKDFHDQSLSLHERYVLPAVAAIAGGVDREVRKSGGAPPKFYDLPTVVGIDLTMHGAIGGLPKARVIRAYDPISEEYLIRADCSVRI
jgi:hypothetical protein